MNPKNIVTRDQKNDAFVETGSSTKSYLTRVMFRQSKKPVEARPSITRYNRTTTTTVNLYAAEQVGQVDVASNDR